MGSSRLPGKSMIKLGGVLTIQHVYARTLAIKRLDGVILATSTSAQDDPLAGWAQAVGLDVYRGCESNVALRILEACQTQRATHIARITGDCPLLDPVVSDEVISVGMAMRADFACNYTPPSFPDGLDFSIFPAANLENAVRLGLSRFDREHVTTYFEKDFAAHKHLNLRSPDNLSGHRWTLDNPQDQIFLDAFLNRLGEQGTGFSHLDALEVLRQNPEIVALQSRSFRNYGHFQGEQKSHPSPKTQTLDG